MTGPAIIGSSRSHDALRRALRAHPPCKALDAPCGKGPVAALLKELGWEVHCADIDAGHLEVEADSFTVVNLNRELPFPDATFDAVVCANAAHRIFNVGGAMKEFARVLRPGGTLFLNVNNYASITRRLRFLVYGSVDNAVNLAHCDQTTADPEAHVRIAVTWAQLEGALEAAGLRVERVLAADVRPAHVLLAPLGWLIRLLGLLAGPRSRRRNRLGRANGPGLLPGGNYLLTIARKPA